MYNVTFTVLVVLVAAVRKMRQILKNNMLLVIKNVFRNIVKNEKLQITFMWQYLYSIMYNLSWVLKV